MLGAGAVGMLSTLLLRLADVEVWTASREPSDDLRAELAGELGARYVSTAEIPVGELRAEAGGFDLVVEATGSAGVMAETLGLLRRSRVACLLGIDPHADRVELDAKTLAVDAVLENRVLFGSVNAQRQDWLAAVDGLDQARGRWPETLERLIGLRVPLDRFADAFGHDGVKATLVLDP